MGRVGVQEKVDIGRALRAGVRFLADAQRDGSWQDFELYVGRSDEWVTAYVGCALAGCDDGLSRKAWEWLARRAEGRGPGYRFNGHTTPDADSTVWACRLAELLGMPVPLAFLKSCRRPDGGVATYPSCDAVRSAIRVPAEMPVHGWASSHVCVSAAAAGVASMPKREALLRFLRQRQMAGGEWHGYWWCDPEYATALGIEALGDARAVAYLAKRGCNGPAFPLALRITGMVLGGGEPSDRAVTRLAALQRIDGSWPASARLRIPAPHQVDPERRWNWDGSHKGFGSIRLDRNRIFTTATAVRALSLWTRR